MIKFVDLRATHGEYITNRILLGVMHALESSGFILGAPVERFEQKFAKMFHAEHAVGVGCGLDALTIALMCLGIGEGDEVIVPANTFIATALAVSRVGATPVLVDCDDTYCINPELMENAITDRTRAVIPVHFAGVPADMDKINHICHHKHNIAVVEDACQAHGAFYKGSPCGSIGDIGCFSFYPSKNLGGIGDGGMLVTNNECLAEMARMIRNYGAEEKYHHALCGLNSRLDTIQAIVLDEKLPVLPYWNGHRRLAATWYRRRLEGIDMQEIPGYTIPVYHLFIIEVPRRDALREFLLHNGIETGVHYPIPIHLQPAYAHLGYKRGDFPVTECIANTGISLPMHPYLIEREVDFVCEKIREFVQ